MFGKRKEEPKLWLVPKENTAVGLQCLEDNVSLYHIRNNEKKRKKKQYINLLCLPLPSFGRGQTVQLALLLFAVRLPPECLG